MSAVVTPFPAPNRLRQVGFDRHELTQILNSRGVSADNDIVLPVSEAPRGRHELSSEDTISGGRKTVAGDHDGFGVIR